METEGISIFIVDMQPLFSVFIDREKNAQELSFHRKLTFASNDDNTKVNVVRHLVFKLNFTSEVSNKLKGRFEIVKESAYIIKVWATS